jgi:hypothetical protein
MLAYRNEKALVHGPERFPIDEIYRALADKLS